MPAAAGGAVWLTDRGALLLQREARLARLTAWYWQPPTMWTGATPAGTELPLQRGDAHRDACRLLALFGSDEEAAA